MIEGSNNVISVKRLELVSGKESIPSAYLYEDLPCYLEPIDPQTAAMLGGVPAYKTYKCFIEGVFRIRISDEVTDQDSILYTVAGVQIFENNTDVPNHVELILDKKYAGD